MHLTEFEFQVLEAIDKSEYGDYLTDMVWQFSVSERIQGLSKTQFPGVVSSLVKKGLANSQDYEGRGRPNDFMIGMTDLGATWYTKACQAIGKTPKKEP